MVLPRIGGSYESDKKGKLKQIERTKDSDNGDEVKQNDSVK